MRPLLTALGACGVLALACQTMAPPAGSARANLDSYGVTSIEVIAFAVSPPLDGSDADLRIAVDPPPPLDLDDDPGRAVDEPPAIAARYARRLADRLRALGYRATSGDAVGSQVRELLRDAAARQIDAVLLVRYLPLSRLTTGELERVERRLVTPQRPFESSSYVTDQVFTPTEHRGLLLLSTVQLFDARSGALLYRGPRPAAARGSVPDASTDLLRWGAMTSGAGAEPVDGEAVVDAASALALAGLPARSGSGRRTVDEEAARRVAAVEGVEAVSGWQFGAFGSTGWTSFPLSLTLGPTISPELIDGGGAIPLTSGGLLRAGAHGGGIEIGHRWQRLVVTGRLVERFLPGTAALAFVRTDADAARAFPVRIGPAHDVGLDLMVGYQRLLWPHLGVRAGLGPALRVHWTAAQVPS
ncbi:MAG: hypothetical protein JXR83_11585, partial [Deltaproteobacteria bacterium]|nr:hypothetical protein [Deltaproteobacteria bacterium]